MSHKIFISYRRFDTAGTAGRLHDGLNEAFGEEKVFRDVHDIPAGVDFRDVLEQELKNCKIVLVLIGQHYTSMKDDEGNLRIFNPNDFVHMEVASAINMRKIVIPVLVDGVGMPKPQELPEQLQELVNFNAVVISHDRWKTDVSVLVKKLEYHMGPAKGKQNKNIANYSNAAPQSSGFTRVLGPMVVGGLLTLFLLIFVIALPSYVKNSNSDGGIAMAEIENPEMYKQDETEAPVKQPETDKAGFDIPKPKENIPQEYNNQSTSIEQTGGYGLPTVDEKAGEDTDYWGFEKKETLEDVLVGTWEQTYPSVPDMHLRESFREDGAYTNNYQKSGLYYIVVANQIQINGRNVYEFVSMNNSGTEMELKSIEGGGLIKKYRKILN